MITLILCALICGIIMSWVLAPHLHDRAHGKTAWLAAFAMAVISIALYLWVGRPL